MTGPGLRITIISTIGESIHNDGGKEKSLVSQGL